MDQNQNPFQTQYPQEQQVNQTNVPYTQGVPQSSPYPQPVQVQQSSPYPQPVQGQQSSPYPQPVQGQQSSPYPQPVQGQQSPQQPYSQPQQTYGQSAPQQPYGQSAPQQSYVQSMPQQAYAGQYGYAQKKKINPLVIILPIAAVVIIVGVVLAIVLLGGKNGGGSAMNLSTFNRNNPFTVSAEDYYGDDVSELLTVKTAGSGDIKDISNALLDYFYEEGDTMNKSIDFIVGEPVCITYKSADVDGDITLTYELSNSLLKDAGYYDGYFSGVERYDIYVVKSQGGSWVIKDSDQFYVDYGYDDMVFEWESSDNLYIVVVDYDALNYAFGYEF